MRTIGKTGYLGLVGGTLYVCLETLWRGYTHWTMALVGGTCFVLILRVSRLLPEHTGLLLRGAAGAAAVTAVEFTSGVVLNVWLKLGIWDYSELPLNILGQVCPLFSLAWALLCVPVILLGEFMNRRFFGEPPRRYTLLGGEARRRAVSP